MSRILKNTVFLSFLISFLACEEVGPEIRLEDPVINEALLDTSYTISNLPSAQPKTVIIEDFTGVRCVNCPLGHQKVEDLKASYGNQIIPMAMHSDFLAAPYDDDQDLRSEAAQSLDQRLGPTIAKPTGAINRVVDNGEILFFINQWAQVTAQEITKTPIVNISIENTSDKSEGVRVKAKIVFLENIEDALAVSVFLLENDIEVTQLTPDGEDEAYIHDHVLRTALTPFDGLDLQDSLYTAGTVLEKEFEVLELDESWNAEHFEVVVMLHSAVQNLEIKQSAVLALQ